MINEVWKGDCLEEMKNIEDGSIDAIICDLPYGTTACKWDTVIPFEPLWEQYNRIIKTNGAIVLFGSEPFSSALRMSNIKNYKYDWIWEKQNGSNSMLCKKQPLKFHENISLFYKKQTNYNPQMWEGKPNHTRKYEGKYKKNTITNTTIKELKQNTNGIKYPRTIIKFNSIRTNKLHPTQKPVALIEYLIKTYTNEGDLVLDNCAGSGTCGVSAQNTKRNFILIEKEQEYINIINKRLSSLEKEIINPKE